jgi:hypothetical protein
MKTRPSTVTPTGPSGRSTRPRHARRGSLEQSTSEPGERWRSRDRAGGIWQCTVSCHRPKKVSFLEHNSKLLCQNPDILGRLYLARTCQQLTPAHLLHIGESGLTGHNIRRRRPHVREGQRADKLYLMIEPGRPTTNTALRLPPVHVDTAGHRPMRSSRLAGCRVIGQRRCTPVPMP